MQASFFIYIDGSWLFSAVCPGAGLTFWGLLPLKDLL